MFTLDNVRKCLRGGLISALLILLVSCAFDNNAEAGMKIQVVNGFESSKTISADNSITGGNSSIDIFGLEISTEDGSKVLYSNENLAEDVVYLQDIVAGTYRFTVRGYISGGATPFLVAESTEVHEVGNGSTLSLTLKDPIEGNISGFSFNVYAPYEGEYSHTADEVTIRYSEGEDVIISITDGTLSYAGEGSDEYGTYWSYSVTASGIQKIKSGKCVVDFKAASTEGEETVCSDTAVLFAGVSYSGKLNGQKGNESVEHIKLSNPEITKSRFQEPAGTSGNPFEIPVSLELANSTAYPDGYVLHFRYIIPDSGEWSEWFEINGSSSIFFNSMKTKTEVYISCDGYEDSDSSIYFGELSKLPKPVLSSNGPDPSSGSLVVMNQADYIGRGVITFEILKKEDFKDIYDKFTGAATDDIITGPNIALIVNVGDTVYVRAVKQGYNSSDVSSYTRTNGGNN